MGGWQLLSVLVLLGIVFVMLYPILSLMTPGFTPSVALIYQILDSIITSITIVGAITIPITLFFGYYSYKAGQLCGVGTLKLAGFSSIIMALGYPMVVAGIYQLMSTLLSMMPTPPPNAYQIIMGSVGLLALGALIVGGFYLIFFFSFIIAASAMKNRTGINDFGTAMWLSIVGLFIPFIFPIGLLLFGSGLSKLARQGEPTPTGAAAPAAPVAPAKAPVRRETMYCPYCGARVDPDAIFCQSCGSSLRKE